MTLAGKQPISQTSGDYAALMKCVAVAVLVCVLVACATDQAVAASADEAAYTAGLQAVRAGDNTKAVTLFSQAIELNPRDFRYYNDRGIAYKASGNLEKALEDYSKALAIKPDYPNALNNRGLLFVQQHQFDKAVDDFRKALQCGGFEAKIHTNLGLAYAGKGDHEAAIKAFQSAMTFRPMDPRAYYFMAQSLEKMGKNDRALKMYQVALGLVKNPATEQYIEKRIVVLEREKPQPQPQVSSTTQTLSKQIAASVRQMRAPLPPPAPVRPAPRPVPAGKTKRAQREIVRARTVAVPPVKTDDRAGTVHEPLPTTLKELDRQSRSRALEKFSANSAEIFRQGMQFLDQADPKRAVIRFEDTLQLERRNRNAVAVAWSMMQAGRAYLKIGDRLKATAYLEAALKIFQRLKSGDETILALVDIAEINKATGHKEQASRLLSDALSQASAAKNRQVASVLRDMLAGRSPSAEKRAATAATSPRDQEKRADAPAGSSTAEARLDLVKRRESSAGARRDATPTPGPAVAKEEKRRTPAQTAGMKKNDVAVPSRLHGPVTWGRTKSNPSAVRVPETSQKRVAQQNAPAQPKHAPRLPDKVQPVPRRVVPSKPVTVETGVGGKPAAVVQTSATRAGKRKGPKVAVTQEQRAASTKPIMPRLTDFNHRLTRQERREAAAKRVAADLTELKRFNNAGDETGMIVILERLSRRYILRRQYDKALHGLTASLALREKLGLDGPAARLFDERGAIKQKLSDPVGALEDISRALVLSEAQGGSSSDTLALEARCRVLAGELGLDPGTALSAYRTLWKARRTQDGRGETDALHAIGTLYDKAQKPSEALNYYDRSAASVLADKARMYEKLGKRKLAEQSYKEALEAFKRLDYSRYLVVLKESGLDSTLSARSRR